MTLGRGGIFGMPMADKPWDIATDRFGFGKKPALPTEETVAPQQPTAQQRAPSVGSLILGTIGDTVSQWAGGKGTFLPALQMQRQRQQEMQDAQVQRANQFTDWQQRYDYEAAHPKASNAQPYRFEANNGDVYQLDANNQPQKVFSDPSPKMNFIPDGMGGGRWVPLPTAGAAPSAPVGRLTPMGGATPNGSRTFPVR